MALDTWIAFLLASCLIAISPGSGAVLSMSHGLSYGVKRTTMTILGMELGLVLIILIAGAGVGSLLLASEIAFNIVKILGALYLIYLGWLQWRAPIAAETLTPTLTTGSDKTTLSAYRRFITGFLTNASNPKAIVFMVAVLPQFIDQSRSLGLQLLIVCVTMVVVDIFVMHGYAFMASAFQKLLSNAKAARMQNQLFGGMLMAMGVALFFFDSKSSIDKAL
jgi:homoserine/homoserine lactone efflux protein